jgi:AcrR family transcriptional regulator
MKSERRSNADRSREMREMLVAVGRRLFVEKGYGDTSTPEIVAAAGVTRGALYHHFADKAALFHAVVVAESEAVAAEIDAATADCRNGHEALARGTDAFLAAMATPARTRLLLLDGPAVLGRAEMDRIDGGASGETIVRGLSDAAGRPADRAMQVRARLLSAAFDRAALEIAAGADAGPYKDALKQMISEAARQI